MRWEDERYVRLYTRDTGDWLFLSFDAQALMMMLLRKVDRAGILHLGKHGRDAIAVTLGHAQSHDRIGAALDQLLADGCVQLDGEKLVIPNFIEAQEARISDVQRKRDQRERDRDKLVSDGIRLNAGNLCESTKPPRRSHAVTRGHMVTEKVTPSLAVPSLTKTKKETTLSGSPTGPDLVFQEWKATHRMPKAIFTAKRKRAVTARLKEGYAVDRLVAAVKGCALDPFSMGENDRHTPFNDLELICRDGTHVEKFEALAPSGVAKPAPMKRKTDEEIMAEINSEHEVKHGRILEGA